MKEQTWWLHLLRTFQRRLELGYVSRAWDKTWTLKDALASWAGNAAERNGQGINQKMDLVRTKELGSKEIMVGINPWTGLSHIPRIARGFGRRQHPRRPELRRVAGQQPDGPPAPTEPRRGLFGPGQFKTQIVPQFVFTSQP